MHIKTMILALACVGAIAGPVAAFSEGLGGGINPVKNADTPEKAGGGVNPILSSDTPERAADSGHVPIVKDDPERAAEDDGGVKPIRMGDGTE